MKKMFLCVAALIFSFSVFAQDIIVTRASERIEAKVTEVSETQVKYKKYNNQEGPTFVLQAQEISTIMYQSGEVQVFGTHQQNHQPQQYYQPQNTYQPSYSQENNNEQNQVPQFVKNGDYYMLGSRRMNESEYFQFIQDNCAEAWESYQKGRKLWATGWVLFGVGMAANVVGPIVINSGTDIDKGYWTAENIAGLTLCIAGPLMTTASIPCIIVGGVKKYNSHKVYNRACSSPELALEFGIQASQNGIGLAMSF